jgi:putative two-component system response regulator
MWYNLNNIDYIAQNVRKGFIRMKTIFVVDDNTVNLVTAEETLSEHYNVITLASAALMFDLLANVKPSLILLDIIMPEMDGFEALKQLKSNPLYKDIPVIFLSSKNDSDTEALGFEAGVIDFISKPFSKPVLVNRIKTHLEIESIIHTRTNNLIKLKNSILSVLANLVECRDETTGNHVERTTKYVRLLLEAMIKHGVYSKEMKKWDLEMVVSSASLHDIGKISITDAILNKPDSLTNEEFDIMKTHVNQGEWIVDNIIHETGGIEIGKEADGDIFLYCAKLFAGFHHERWDGKGYPYGLKAEEIPLHGRVMAIADVYDALTSDRPYKKAFTHEEAVDIIKKGSGTQFDPKLVDMFLMHEEEFSRVTSELDKETESQK